MYIYRSGRGTSKVGGGDQQKEQVSVEIGPLQREISKRKYTIL